jgi:hypothetical protein
VDLESPSDSGTSTPDEVAAEPEPEIEPSSAPPSGSDLSQAALFRDPEDATAPAADPETALGADDADRETAASETAAGETADTSDVPPPEEDEPTPPSDGPAHTPRTDVDISGSGSLFDI